MEHIIEYIPAEGQLKIETAHQLRVMNQIFDREGYTHMEPTSSFLRTEPKPGKVAMCVGWHDKIAYLLSHIDEHNTALPVWTWEQLVEHDLFEGAAKCNTVNWSLNKQDFWNAMYRDYPLAMRLFCHWVDNFKERVKWDELFDNKPRELFMSERHCAAKNYKETVVVAERISLVRQNPVKFHDIPHVMQKGIIMEFFQHVNIPTSHYAKHDVDLPFEVSNHLKSLDDHLAAELEKRQKGIEI